MTGLRIFEIIQQSEDPNQARKYDLNTCRLNLEAEIDGLRVHELNASQLKELKIELQSMTLFGTSDRKPSFVPAPVDCARQVKNSWSFSTFHSGFVVLEDMLWSAKDVGFYVPYKSAVIYNNLDWNDQHILRGELLIILRLMSGQLQKRRFLHHMKAPLLIISFMGKFGRVIEAYFDGQSLILGCTKLYSFRSQTSTAFRDSAEWYLSNPVGNTVQVIHGSSLLF
ncbi:hypothetical protein BDV28DRAFT_159064 [Aspergillus coremiiformis]|uniref:Uncharacterized protein n=1 Tax=Aspergillus coremiiformis TaxID=138285 RepID=A0A5N6Z062_9EURO|nr:hypothetical protein BDV28DRAFT_159064 [Aspergillus coremiiformis]